MTVQDNKALIRRLIDEVANTGDLDRTDALVAADCVDHAALATQPPGPAGFKQGVAMLRAAFPDLQRVSCYASPQSLQVRTVEEMSALRELGLFSLIIPEEHGGLALSNAAYARVLAQTSSYDSSVSLTIGAHSSIGMKGILLFGTPAQKGAALALVEQLELDGYHYLHATRAELLRRLDRVQDARAAYDRALQLVHSEAERRFLERRLAELPG